MCPPTPASLLRPAAHPSRILAKRLLYAGCGSRSHHCGLGPASGRFRNTSPRSTPCGPAAHQAFRLGFGGLESGTLFSQNREEKPAGPLPSVSPPQTSPRSPPFTWDPSLRSGDSFPRGAGGDARHQGLGGDLALPDTQIRGRLCRGRSSLLLPFRMCLGRGRGG